LITGANHGIGAATARAFAGQGCKVFISYRAASPHSEEQLKKGREAGIGGPELYYAMRQQSAEPLVQVLRAGGLINFKARERIESCQKFSV
jgi:3-oxoacyl-[acyl-carrier protein] reductase